MYLSTFFHVFFAKLKSNQTAIVIFGMCVIFKDMPLWHKIAKVKVVFPQSSIAKHPRLRGLIQNHLWIKKETFQKDVLMPDVTLSLDIWIHCRDCNYNLFCVLDQRKQESCALRNAGNWELANLNTVGCPTNDCLPSKKTVNNNFLCV